MSDLIIDCISDTHGRHKDISLPGGDILIHAGDTTGHGTLKETENFAMWFKSQPYRYHVMIPGNHDAIFEESPKLMRDSLANNGITVLNDTMIEIEGLKIWGSPVTPYFCNWHYNRHRGQEIKTHWEMIPDDIDILITHGPPFDILDKASHSIIGKGCVDLMMAIQERPSIKLHVFGHLHFEGMKSLVRDGRLYVNAAYLDESYQPGKKTHVRVIYSQGEFYVDQTSVL